MVDLHSEIKHEAAGIGPLVQQHAHNDSLLAAGLVISTDPLRVRLFGDTGGSIAAQVLSNYSPVSNDKVVAMRVGLQWIVIGAYSSSIQSRHPAPIAWQTPQWVSGNTYSAHFQGVEVSGSISADRIYFVPYTHSHGIGRAIDAIVVSNSTTDATSHTVGLYASDASGLPGILIDSVEDTLDSTYKVFAFAADVELAPATTYWLAWHLASAETASGVDSTNYYPLFMFNVGDATPQNALLNDTQGRFYVSRTYSLGLPNPFPDPSTWTAETLAGSQFVLMGVRAA